MTLRKKVLTCSMLIVMGIAVVIGNITWLSAQKKTANLMLIEASVSKSGVISEWDSTYHHNEAYYAYLGDSVAYCLNYSLKASGGQSMTGSSTPTINLTDKKKKQILLALYFGYSNTKNSSPNKTQKNQYIATQAVIWNITKGLLGSSDGNHAAKKLCKTAPDGDASYSYYEQVRDKVLASYNNDKPSFAKKEKAKSNTFTLEWNEKKERFETVLHDDKGMLDNYSLSLSGYKTEKKGSDIVIYTKKAISGTKTASLKSNSNIVSVEDSSTTYWTNNTKGYQDFAGGKPDTTRYTYYFKVKTNELSKEEFIPINTLEQDDIVKIEIEKHGEMLTAYEDNQFKYEIRGLAGAEFEISAANDITYKDNLIYSKDQVVEKIVSDENGHAVSGDLCPGEYIVKEVLAPEGFVLNQTPLSVTLEKGQKKTLDVSNDRKKVSMSIEKTDSIKHCPLEGAKFSLYAENDIENCQGDVIVKAGTLIEEATSGSDGNLTFTKDYPIETYVVRETKAPNGYDKCEDEIIFDATKQTEEGAVIAMKEAFGNCPVAELTIYKVGEVLIDVESMKNPDVIHRFIYSEESLEGITFDVFAGEDISYLQGTKNTTIEKGTKVGTVTTDKDGKAKLENLPLGTYLVKETTTLPGYVLDTEEKKVKLDNVNENAEVETESLKVLNKKQRVNISVTKASETDQTPLSGAVFGLYSKKDIVSNDGKVLVKADELIENATTGVDGKCQFTDTLPNGEYYVIEEKAPAGYVNGSQRFDISAEFSQSAGEVMNFTNQVTNAPIIVDFTKTDITGENEIVGAKLSVIDSKKKVVETWISEETPHRIVGLPAGIYTLREEMAPFGYTLANDIKFTVTETAQVQHCAMKDEQVKGQIVIYKTDETGKLMLKGAEFTVTNDDGEVVDVFTSDKNGEAKSKLLPAAKFENGVYQSDIVYHVQETKAPKGYILNESIYDLTFAYKDDKTPVIVQMATIKNRAEEVVVDETMPNAPAINNRSNTSSKLSQKISSGGSQTAYGPVKYGKVNTGDETNIRNWIAIAACALLGISFVTIGAIKDGRRGKKHE